MQAVTIATSSENEQQFQDKVSDLVALARDCEVVDDDSAGRATDVIKLLSAMTKRVEEDCKILTRPLDALKKEIRARYEPLKAELASALANIKGLHTKYLLAKRAEETMRREEARLAELARIEALPKENQDSALMRAVENDSVPVRTSVRGEYGSSGHIRETWKFELLDIQQVPVLLYLKLDEVAVRDAIRRGEREIPGVRIYLQSDGVVR